MIKSTYLDMIKENIFISSLTNEIYDIIDEEMLKGDNMNCELVDSLVEALDILQQEGTEKIFGIIPFMLEPHKIKSKATRSQNVKKIIAVAASLALIFSGVNSMLQSTQDTTLVREIVTFFNNIKEYFDIHEYDEPDAPHNSESVTTEIPDETTSEEPTSEEPTSDEPVSNETPNVTPSPSPVVTKQAVPVKLELISEDSFKTDYLWQEALDLTGLSAVAVYSDGTRRDIPPQDLTVTGFNSAKVGKQTVTVSFEGVSSSFTVNVTKTEHGNTETRKAVRAELMQKELYAPNNLEVPISYDGNFWRYVYSDGTLSPWQSLDKLTLVTEIDRNNITAPQMITYQTPDGLAVTASIQLFDSRGSGNNKSVSEIKVKRYPKQLHPKDNFAGYYVYQNVELDINSFVLYIRYTDMSIETVSAETPTLGIYGDLTTAETGNHTVVFTYGNKTLKFTYTVIEDDLEIAWFEFTQLWYTYYVNDGRNENAEKLAPDFLDVSRLVRAKFKGSNESLYIDVEIEGYDKTKLGIISVDVYFRDKYLGTTAIGQIYGDTGYVFTENPEKTFYTKNISNFQITVHMAKCIGNGRLETVEDFYNEPGNENRKPSKYDATLFTDIYGYKGFSKVTFRNTPTWLVEYQITFRPVTDFGEYTLAVNITDQMLADSCEHISNPTVTEIYKFRIEIKKAPNFIRAEVPTEPAYCRADFEEQYKNKIRVFAVYSDGSEEEVFDYDLFLICQDGDDTVGQYQYFISYRLQNLKYETCTNQFFIYEEGYEDAFCINYEYVRSDYPGVCELNSKQLPVRIRFYAGSCEIAERRDEYTLEYLNFDTSTLGTRTATAVYTNALGTFTCDFEYTVVDKIVDPLLKIEIYDENALADPFTGLDQKYFDVYYIDGLKQRHIVTDKCTIAQKCGGTFSMSGASRFTTTIFATYYDENTNTTFECNSSGILTRGNINSVSVQKDEKTGQYGVKVDADLPDDYIYEVKVRVYDSETHYISLGGYRKELEKKGALLGSFSTDATEFLIDDTILPTQKTKFYVYVNIVISSKDGTQSEEAPTYYVLYKV